MPNYRNCFIDASCNFGNNESLPGVFSDVANSGLVPFPGFDEGSWLPMISFATPGTLAVTYSAASGSWQRHGKWVQLSFSFNFVPTLGTAAGQFQIINLPFPASIETGGLVSYMDADVATWPAGAVDLALATTNAQSFLKLVGNKPASNPVDFTAANFTSGATVTMRGNIRYLTTAPWP